MHKNGSLEKMSDSELVEIAKKDQEIFGVLMARYQWPIFHYVRRISGLAQEDIEDMLQEIFTKVYLNLNDYDGSLKFSSWIYRISHNHVIDNFRKISARPKMSTMEDDEWMKIVRSDVDIENELANKDCVKKIKEVIEKLPLKYREILYLRFLEEKEYEEIMDILRKPKGTVATLIARGKKMLVEELKKAEVKCSK